MSITQITEQEQRLTSMLRTCTEALKQVTAERDGLRAARVAYASEFPGQEDDDGIPDVGSIHQNIRALKAERDRLTAELKSLRDSGVELPEPFIQYSGCEPMFTEAQIRDYGDRMAIAERGRLEKLLDTKVGAGRSNPQRRNEMKTKLMQLADDYAGVPSDTYYLDQKYDSRAALEAEVDRVTAERDAQRKVLKQALEALTWYVEEDDVIESMEGNEFWVDGKRKGEAAITAIQEQLA